MCQVWTEALGGRATVKPSGGVWETSANSWTDVSIVVCMVF